MTVAGAAPGAEEERLVDRIGKLLAQAEGTDNEHEAAAFVERAQTLATAYAVDLERARRRQARSGRAAAEPLEQEQVEIGPRGQRGNRHRVLLYAAVAAVNDVRLNVSTDSTYVLAFGARADLDVVERLWASLAVQMTAAAQRRLDRGEHRRSGVATLSWRLSFYDGFVAAVAGRLRTARDRAVAAAEPAAAEAGAGSSGGTEPSAALVLRARSDRVEEFYRQASRARGTWRGTTSGRTRVSGAAQRSGQADGEQADLGQARLRARGRLAP